MNPKYPESQASTAGQISIGGGLVNPTLRENINAKIQWHRDEIQRLEKVQVKLEFMMDVNLRDLREAMQF